MPRKRDSSKSTKRQEEWYQLAVEKIQDGCPLRAVAKEFGIPRSTLRGRIEGANPRHTDAKSRYRISEAQEGFLIDWIHAEEAAGRPPSLEGVAGMAKAILTEQGDVAPLGKSWTQRFFKRHETQIKLKTGRLVDIERIEAVTEANIAPWFDRLREIVALYNIRATNLYNMDETGTQEGESSTRKVAGNASIRGTKVAKPSNTDWVSAIECISASGRRLQPAMVFKGVHLQSNWAPPEGFPRWHYKATPSGWTNTDIAFNWMEEVFLPQTKPVSAHDWRLLILDGFSTHINHFFQLIAFRNKVQLYYLPAHTSHRLQPLDVAVFAPLKVAYRNHIRSAPIASLPSPASKQRFIEAYEKARDISMTVANIKSGFAATGIWPLNGSVVLEEVRQQRPPISRTFTPPNLLLHAKNAILYTPSTSKEVTKQFRYVDSPAATGFEARWRKRSFVQFAGRRIDRNTATIASLRTRLNAANAQLAAYSSQKGKRVKIDPNRSFATVEDFEAARVAKEAELAREAQRAKVARAKYDLDARKAYKEIKHVKFEDLCMTWQLE